MASNPQGSSSSKENPKGKEYCNVCSSTERLLRCARCKNVLYCGQKHQKEDWKNHKVFCVAPITTSTTNHTSQPKRMHSSMFTPPERNVDPTTKNKNGSNTVKDTGNNIENNARSSSSTLINPKQTYIPLYSVRDYDMNIDDYIITPSPARSRITSDDISNREYVLKKADYLVEKLMTEGFCVINDYLGESTCSKVLWDVISILRAGLMKPGQIVSNVDVKEKVRGDKIAWITGTEETYENMRLVMNEMDRLIRYCSGRLGNIKGRTPAMVACYPGDGTGYKRHIDNAVKDGRRVTCLYYLNKGWDSEEMGGQLRMFPLAGTSKVDIDPISDRLVVFWSDRRTPHEVLPAYHQRFAVTLWYFDANEREQVKEKYFLNLKNAFASNVQVTPPTVAKDDSIRVPSTSVIHDKNERVEPESKDD